MTPSTTVKGQRGEQAARMHLEQQGLAWINSNWRCRYGELDLVMSDGDVLVFVEVKLRNRDSHGGALGSVTARKQQRLLRAAQCYLQSNYDAQGAPTPPCRFDVVSIESPDANPQLQWLRSAFGA